MIVALIFHWLSLSLARGEGAQLSLFFLRFGDFGADFFNQLRYVAERNPYFNNINGPANHSWPPLPWLLLYPASRLQPYATMSLRDCWTSPVSMMSLVLFLTAVTLIFAHALQCLCKKWNVPSVITAALFASGWYMYTMERGNIVILSAACVMYFIAYYDSSDARLRLFACFTLSVAATMKIYPVLFAFLLFEKKQYKEMAWGAFFCALLGLLPFLFFKHGFGNIPRLLRNARAFPQSYQMVNGGFTCAEFVRMILSSLHAPHSLWAARVFGNCVRLASCAGLLLSLHEENHTRRFSLVVFAVMVLPGWSGTYTALYLFPLILRCVSLTLTEKDMRWGGVFMMYTILFLMLEPFQIRIGALSVNHLFLKIAPLCFFLCALVSSARLSGQARRNANGGKLDTQ